MSRLHRLLAAAAAAGALLAGCVHSPVGPDYVAPAALLHVQAASAGPFRSVAGNATDEALPPNWWHLYQDPLLDALVAQAFAHNTDLRQAVANFEREQALEAEVRGPERPTLALSGGPGFGHVSGLTLVQKDYEPPGRFTYGASANLSYQLDLFGQLRRAIEAAEAGSGAAQAAVDLVRVNVAGGTARAYAEVCTTGLRLRSARESVRLQQEAVQLAQRLQQAGKVGPIDTARARGQLELLRASLPPLQAQRQNALYRLATLTGAARATFLPTWPAATGRRARQPRCPWATARPCCVAGPTCARPNAAWRPPPPASAWRRPSSTPRSLWAFRPARRAS